jgi:hypothetical protein
MYRQDFKVGGAILSARAGRNYGAQPVSPPEAKAVLQVVWAVSEPRLPIQGAKAK